MPNIFTYFKSPTVFEVWHSHPSQTSQVLITAGMHGDERSSIKAAQNLINTYQGDIPITIIPILNLAGYHQNISINPLDQKDPIYIYPGSRYGSSSSQLMHQLSRYTQSKKLWIDLHGGAKNEQLNPFIWASDLFPFLSYLDGRVLVENSFKRDLPYLILEAGEGGIINQKAINLHMMWVEQILSNFDKPAKPNWHPSYNKILYESRKAQSVNAPNFLWCSPTLYVSGKIA